MSKVFEDYIDKKESTLDKFNDENKQKEKEQMQKCKNCSYGICDECKVLRSK